MHQVIVFPRGQLKTADRKALRAAGIVPIEADDPAAVVTVLPMAAGAGIITPDAMLMSLLRAIVASNYDSVALKFIAELERRLLAQEKASTAQKGGAQ